MSLVADYKGDPVDLEHAAWAVQQAQAFVQRVISEFMHDFRLPT